MGNHTVKHKEFELLERVIYSMHISSGRKFNIRILYGFLSNQKPALLMAFYERGGHSNTDYTGKMDTALIRLKELENNIL